MPTDISGNYSLPPGYEAVTGEIIQATQHNPPLEDIESALTGRLPRSGAAAMTGQLKLSDGTVSAPALSFGSATNWGLIKTSTGIGLVIDGALVLELGGTPTGAILDYAGTTAPAGFLLCYGQAISRSTYSALFTAIGTTHGVGDGTTTFNLPDYRGRFGAGKDDMGGSAASRITGAAGGVDGLTLGAVGGAQTRTIAQANLPAVTLTTTIAAGQGSHSHLVNGTANKGDLPPGSTTISSDAQTVVTQSQALPAMSGTTPLGGSGTALATLPTTIIVNKIIKI